MMTKEKSVKTHKDIIFIVKFFWLFFSEPPHICLIVGHKGYVQTTGVESYFSSMTFLSII